MVCWVWHGRRLPLEKFANGLYYTTRRQNSLLTADSRQPTADSRQPTADSRKKGVSLRIEAQAPNLSTTPTPDILIPVLAIVHRVDRARLQVLWEGARHALS